MTSGLTGSIRFQLKTNIAYIILGIITLSNAQIIVALEPDTNSIKQTNEPIYEFDSKSLFGGSTQAINSDIFIYKNTVNSGIYNVEISINNINRGNHTVSFKPSETNITPELCVNANLIELFDLKNDFFKSLSQQECINIKEIDKNSFYEFDQNILHLKISLPLAIINERPKGYIPIDQFDKGVSSAFIGYDLNGNTSKFNTQDRIDYLFLNLKGGINWNGFNFRHGGSFSSDQTKLNKYTSYLNAVSTDLLPIESRLTTGDFYTQSYNISSANIRGFQLATDNSMRPSSQQNYAPVIQGIANTNALVSIFQDGQKVYERNVPAGNFVINDLTTINNSGDLTVQVTETNGDKSSFIIPNQGSFNLIRPHQFNYSFALGRYRLNEKITKDYLAQFSFEYGLTNNLTLFSGTNFSESFQNYILGIGANTKLGGVKFSGDYSNANLLNQDIEGYKYRTTYQYNFTNTQTNLMLGALYQTQKYMSLSNTMSLKNYNYLNEAELDNLFRTYLLKQQIDISIYQQLSKKLGSFYLSATQSKYWNTNDDYVQYQVGYSNLFQKLSYSIGFSKTYNYLNQISNEDRYYITLSIPLDWNKRRANIYSTIQHTNQPTNTFTSSIGASSTFGEQSQGYFGISNNNTFNDSKNESSFSTNIGYNFPQFKFGANASFAENYSQYGFNTNGAFVLHPYGLTATNNISDTYTILHAKDVIHANVINGWGIKTDRFGNAIYSNVSPYQKNEIGIDIQNLPIDIQLKENQMSIIPRRYSSTLIHLDTQKTSNILLELTTPNNVQIPIGLQVKNSNNQLIGTFGQSNQLFIENEEFLQDQITIQWGTENMQQCNFRVPNKEKLDHIENKALFKIINVECK